MTKTGVQQLKKATTTTSRMFVTLTSSTDNLGLSGPKFSCRFLRMNSLPKNYKIMSADRDENSCITDCNDD